MVLTKKCKLPDHYVSGYATPSLISSERNWTCVSGHSQSNFDSALGLFVCVTN